MSNHVFVEHSEVFKIIILILNFVRLSIVTMFPMYKHSLNLKSIH